MYQIALWLHLGTLLVTLVFIIRADHYALSWIRGTQQTLDAHKLRRLHRLVTLGLTLMVLSGAYMASGQLEYLLHETGFLVKLGFVALLIGNSFLIGATIPLAAATPFSALSKQEKLRALLPGGLSLVGWIGAITAALLFFS